MKVVPSTGAPESDYTDKPLVYKLKESPVWLASGGPQARSGKNSLKGFKRCFDILLFTPT